MTAQIVEGVGRAIAAAELRDGLDRCGGVEAGERKARGSAQQSGPVGPRNKMLESHRTTIAIRAALFLHRRMERKIGMAMVVKRVE
ncbi:hypothetical protein GCM10022270_02450 [Terriglobus aquaticus]